MTEWGEKQHVRPLTDAEKQLDVDSLNRIAERYKNSPPSHYEPNESCPLCDKIDHNHSRNKLVYHLMLKHSTLQLANHIASEDDRHD
jgi:hypothetical protein